MVTREQYDRAIADQKSAQETINEFHRQKGHAFQQRMMTNPVFSEDELNFSATSRCPCGYGLAYPKDCGGNHHWDCAGILLGKADLTVKHTDMLPFSFYDIKSESEYRGTTRGSVIPMRAQ